MGSASVRAGSGALGIGLVGAGGIARDRLVPGMRAIPGVELIAVATRGLSSAEAAARELGFQRGTGSWRRVVEDPEVGAVVVATWPDTHARVTLAALDAGKHVLTCGRMAMDVGEAGRMLAASRARPDLVAMLVPGGFSLWADRTLARLLGEGAIGQLRSVRLGWSGGVDVADPWRLLRRYSGDNVMALGIVYEAMVRWLGRATDVSATLHLRTPWMPDREGTPVPMDVPDLVHALAAFPGDVPAVLEMTGDPRPEPQACWFHGSEGTLRADFGRRHLDVHRPGDPATRWTRTPVPPGERVRWRVEAEFVAAIREGAPVTLVDFETGWHGMAFTTAVHESARRGQRVEVPVTA
ncbi:Gfo/Idh/MocA family oxidoreductase [soil metagenome]